MGPLLIRFQAPLRLGQVELMRTDLAAWLASNGFAVEDAYRVTTVVDELFANTMEHSGATWVEVGATVLPVGVAVEMRDDGVAFDPFEAGKKDYSVYLASDTDRRLGLYLVTRLAKVVDYRRDQGRINSVRFVVEAVLPDPMHPQHSHPTPPAEQGPK